MSQDGNEEEKERLRTGGKVSDMTRAQFILRTRKGLGLTQTEFWVPMGIHYAVGGKYELGFRKVPDRIMKLIEFTYLKIGHQNDISEKERSILIFLRKSPEIITALLYVMKLRSDSERLDVLLSKLKPEDLKRD